ncbi:hypothetical protein BH11ACT4_BH11ACT4_10630 [soil metagenome]
MDNHTVLARSFADLPTPTPTPTSGPGAPADLTLSNYFLAVALLIAALLVIVIALRFALVYHTRLLRLLTLVVRKGNATVVTESNDAVDRSIAPSEAPAARVVGPGNGAPGSQLVFALSDATPSDLKWSSTGGTPSTSTAPSYVVTYAKAGTYTVNATYTLSSGGTTKEVSISREISIGAVPKSASITLPFVIKNWGRLVIVIFGVGVISALMAVKVLDAAAGVGILGTLLGVGAVTATTGDGGGSGGGDKGGDSGDSVAAGNDRGKPSKDAG